MEILLEDLNALRVFYDKALRKILGSKREGEKESLMKLHNEELNDVYSSPNITAVIKWRQIRRKGNATGLEEKKSVGKIFVGEQSRRDHAEGFVAVVVKYWN